MALCNIVGDLGYLGYAFAADGFVSAPKLLGALFTMSAHIILLAYGDDQARVIATEEGVLARLFLRLREQAQHLMSFLLSSWQKKLRVRSVGISFSMLSVNGVGLITDALLRMSHHLGIAMADQIVLGALITLGTGIFAAADFVKTQKTADILTKAAPTVLTGASIANIGLALTTWNVFVILSVLAFALSNFTGFFVRLDKEKGQHLHS